MADQLQNTSFIHPNFSGSMTGSIDITGTPNWQKTTGHIPGTAPTIPSVVSPFKITVNPSPAPRFQNALQTIYHN
jgi:hypothetical protein